MSSSAPPRAAARRGARRRTAAVVAVALVGPLSACGSDVGADDDTLRITANVTDRASMDAVVAAFGTLEPDVELSVTYAETDQLQKSLPPDSPRVTAPTSSRCGRATGTRLR